MNATPTAVPGTFLAKFDYEPLNLLGTNLGLHEAAQAAALIHLCDNYGMDAITTRRDRLLRPLLQPETSGKTPAERRDTLATSTRFMIWSYGPAWASSRKSARAQSALREYGRNRLRLPCQGLGAACLPAGDQPRLRLGDRRWTYVDGNLRHAGPRRQVRPRFLGRRPSPVTNYRSSAST